jgi:hypothetical protein
MAPAESRALKVSVKGIDLVEFKPKKAQIMPIFTVKNIRVLCESMEPLEIAECE